MGGGEKRRNEESPAAGGAPRFPAGGRRGPRSGKAWQGPSVPRGGEGIAERTRRTWRAKGPLRGGVPAG